MTLCNAGRGWCGEESGDVNTNPKDLSNPGKDIRAAIIANLFFAARLQVAFAGSDVYPHLIMTFQPSSQRCLVNNGTT